MKTLQNITLFISLLIASQNIFAGGPAPPYDDCAAVGDLASIGSPYSGTTVGATNDYSFCVMGSAADQIFYYDLPVGSTITINQTTNGYDSRHSLRYGGACPGTTEIVCTDDPDTQVESWQNCTGSLQRVYWIQSGYSSNEGTYTLQWSVTAGVCGACSDQTIAALPFSQTGMTTAGFGDDYSSADACASSYMNGDEYIFDYTPATNETININLTNTGTYVGIFVTDGCPDVGTCVDYATNSSGNPSLTCVNLTAGIQYFFTISTWPSPQTTAFDIDIQVASAPPANDECSGAVALTVNADQLCGSVTSSSISGATDSGIGACVGSGADDDVWFSFVATSTTHDISLLNVSGSVTDMVHEIFSGTCPGGLSSIACSDPDYSLWGGFTIGSTYYIRVYSYTATSCQNTTFDICVGTPPPPPSNDEPCGAITLNVNIGSCAYQSAVLGTSSTVSSGMPAPGCGSLGPDVWFKVTVPAGGLIIDMATSGGPTDMDMAWYTGPNCSNLNTLVECDAFQSVNGSMPMICRTDASCTVPGDCDQNPKLTTGTVVYIRVWESGGGTFGPFDICAYEPAAPGGASNCSNATNIASLPFSNSGATTCCRSDNYNSTDGCLSSYMNGEDFMYTYTPAANETVDITLTGTLSYTGLFITDRCPDQGGVNCVASATSASGNPSLCAVNLTGGTTYYIMVDTYPSPDCTPFNISMTSSSTPTCGLNYTMSTIAYAPDLNAGTNIALPIDDRFSSSYVSFGFNFCFDGYQFSQGLVSSNGYLIFDPIGCATNLPGANAAPGDYSAYSINAAIPNTTDAPRNAIMFPWQDIDPSLGGTIKYQTLGTAPNRRFVITFDQVPYYSCTSLEFTGQLKLFETTNMIEMHIGNKENCSTWNGGAGILGLHNYNGTTAVVGVNYPTTWTASNQARRFTYNCVGPCLVLPVVLANFDGIPMDGYNHLNWSTETEINNDYFVIEHSMDGNHFTELGTVDGNGNSTNLIVYDFKHQNPKELEYYRLKQVDFDGKFEYSNVIAINAKQDIDINIFPNPSKDNLYFSLSESVEDETYTVVYTNILGSVRSEEVLVKQGTKTYQVNDFSNLSNGIYFVQILNSQQEVIKTQKIVKE